MFQVPASDMNMLYWSDELAASAQRFVKRFFRLIRLEG